MTYAETVLGFARVAQNKSASLRADPLAFLILALKAGAFVGAGILLIFSVGQGVESAIRPIVMGASFGIALTLVVFAGAELFTGHTMYMTHGLLTGQSSLRDLLRCWAASWAGNLIGALMLALLFVAGGGGLILGAGEDALLYKVAAKKMHGTGLQLFARAVLCNWLVCLALWCSARARDDVTKCIVIFWCLYAFIAAGFEHSVANMTVFSVALLSDHPDTVSLAGAAHNLAFVTLGNAFAGAGIMGYGYWRAASRPNVRTAEANGLQDGQDQREAG
ncbi:formate/nitrite transporter family protein [Phaeobacter gallaeciensis]|uniref:Formate/nitrite family of transporter n=1 Tax=Phaeobacter gallaeciensis TaxID=60890 RepID=A0AAC9Z7F7_9RHOB|nr:formate/nitrite transporter family protein [Phaeobacter gallaeciensis]AHD08907.1 Formate/nitrite family of transporter [Phaeobacter gallaeciensis DSM 26640]ATE92173.1 Formate/nitrite family of transporter [Phaeobacter gallaeciensis]ATE98008.1 Formate/nitrite family of transporter [Phaeobacter gallaeciensis]ATF00835.1 Formate/nitrite family of transporter [Phaeobacter gallaeciensis]ATF05215.1 Formate/nitrite family of transporter [Phaeobacter gallaeciensis]